MHANSHANDEHENHTSHEVSEEVIEGKIIVAAVLIMMFVRGAAF